MKPIRMFLSLVLVAAGLLFSAGLAGTATSATSAAQPEPGRSLVQRLRDQARGSVDVDRNRALKTVGFIKVGRNGDLLPGATTEAAVPKADEFLDTYGRLLGADDPEALRPVSTVVDEYGGTHVTYLQEHRGVPVFGAQLKVHLDKGEDLTSVNGVAVPDIDISVTPRLSAGEAARRAVAAVRADPPATDTGEPAVTTGLEAASSKLLVYRTGLIRDVAGTDQLVYRVEVTNEANVRDIVFVHANAGKVVNRYSMIHDALNRELYEESPANLVWKEGDPFPGALNTDQQNIVNASGDSYWLFANAFGRDSYDGAGATMRSVNNDPTIACPNANWNGATTNYCNGVTSDDVVAHEWGHAYTEFTHNLIYQWQPGALNESYSDIWGEIVDQINGEGTDNPARSRTSDQCSTHTTPRPILVINGPAAIAGQCAAAGADFGPELTATGITGDVVIAEDAATADGPSTTDACTPITNAAAVAGKIALVDRGTCGFTVKVTNAQDAGATAVVVGQNNPGPPAGMGGADPSITIPSLMISQDNRNLIAGQLPAGPVNVTLRTAGGDQVNTVKWLMAEDSPAFGGAIRDMWNPTCLGDPGKVSDAEYRCSTDDSGGVHSNSGVPNHGFSLLVEGGTYNEITVPAIGMTKAAHIYWRAQSVYQTPTTDFADHADALETSCTDLVGQELAALDVDPNSTAPSADVVAAGDCAAVNAMAQAVELRQEPTQCNFEPLLDPNTPRLCSGRERDAIFEDDFEEGLGGWNLSNEGVFSGWPGFDWEADDTLPGDRAGTAAFGIDSTGGNCDGGAGDFSGVMRMASQPIDINGGGNRSTRLTFDHYVATEFGWDGGNVKVSVNGGPFEAIPSSAYIFNPPGTINSAAEGNTNPLAGQPGFTGTDGGEVFGSWGQSQIDFSMIDVGGGDTIRLRFDMGTDGCSGIDGWYVDNVQVRQCDVSGRND